MSEISAVSVFKHRDDIRYRIIDSEAVVIRQEAGEVLGLNQVGARLIGLIDSKTPVGGLLKNLHDEFDVDPDALERDVLGFLEELVEAGVIETVEPRAPEE